jgi:3-oxoacyl-(acyl-carrier-protein) synthase
LECLDPEISGLEIVGNSAKDTSNIGRRSGSGKGIKMAMTNSFGFGGTNASLVFKKAQ